MSNEVITHKHEWVHGLFTELDRIAKDAQWWLKRINRYWVANTI